MNDIIKALDEAELFLRNRTMDGMSLELNEYDIGILRDISQVCARAYDEINRQKAEIEQLQTLVNEMGDYFPACIGCEGKTTLGERTDKCVYEIDNTNYCTKRGITNITSIITENRELKAEIERLKAEVKFSDYLEYEATNQIKAEAIKGFADRLDDTKIKIGNDYVVYADNISVIKKEMVGDV